MVIDTSALVAIVLLEVEADLFRVKIRTAGDLKISAATYLETVMVLSRDSSGELIAAFDEFLSEAQIHPEPVTAEDAFLAREAFLRYGKGRHPAGLNFGDCFSYALAKRLSEPLLFKGEDFSKTDVIHA